MFDILEKRYEQYGKIIEGVIKTANKSMQLLVSDFKTVNGKIVLSEENVQLSIDIVNRAYETINEAGYGKFASKYRADFLKILKEMNAASSTIFKFSFAAKDRALIDAIATTNYAGLFRVEREIGNSIQRVATDYVLTERPIAELQTEIGSQITGRLQRYAKTFVETSTRQAVQKAQDIVVNNQDISPDERYYEYTGPRDSDNRPECIEGMTKRYFTQAERDDFEATYGIRYNCRHVFQYIPKDVYERAVGTWQGSDKQKQTKKGFEKE